MFSFFSRRRGSCCSLRMHRKDSALENFDPDPPADHDPSIKPAEN